MLVKRRFRLPEVDKIGIARGVVRLYFVYVIHRGNDPATYAYSINRSGE